MYGGFIYGSDTTSIVYVCQLALGKYWQCS